MSAGGGPSRRALEIQPEALEDLQHWVLHDRRIAQKILRLIEAACRDPFDGIGKPEPRKHLGPDIWSSEDHAGGSTRLPRRRPEDRRAPDAV